MYLVCRTTIDGFTEDQLAKVKRFRFLIDAAFLNGVIGPEFLARLLYDYVDVGSDIFRRIH